MQPWRTHGVFRVARSLADVMSFVLQIRYDFRCTPPVLRNYSRWFLRQARVRAAVVVRSRKKLGLFTEPPIGYLFAKK